MESDLAHTKARLKEALERVELVHQAMTVDLPHITEVMFSVFLVLSLTPWPYNGCLHKFASCLKGFRDVVDLQIQISSGGAWSDGLGNHGIVVGQ